MWFEHEGLTIFVVGAQNWPSIQQAQEIGQTLSYLKPNLMAQSKKKCGNVKKMEYTR